MEPTKPPPAGFSRDGGLFRPLLRRVLEWWQSPEPALVIAPTSKRETVMALAIPVACVRQQWRGDFPIHFLALPTAVRYAPRPLVCNRGLQPVPFTF